MSEQIRLLLLPTEIRQQIWKYVVQDSRIHLLEFGRSVCNREPNDKCLGPEHCQQNFFSQTQQDVHYQAPTAPSWALVCHQVFAEIFNEYNKCTTYAFISGQAFEKRQAYIMYDSELPRLSLDRLYQVDLGIGSGKFGTAQENRSARVALKMLSNEATSLERLTLIFGYYYGADTDNIHLSSKFLKCILQFRNLQSLHLHLQDPPPGPAVGPISEKEWKDIVNRVEILQSVLTELTCSARSVSDVTKSVSNSGAKPRAESRRVSTIGERIKILLQAPKIAE